MTTVNGAAWERWADSIDHRVGAIEKRGHEEAREVAQDREAIAVLSEKVERMIETFRAVRTALYASGAMILGAAIIVVLLGKHP